MLALNLKFWRKAARKCALFESLKSHVDATPLLGFHFFQSLRCQIALTSFRSMERVWKRRVRLLSVLQPRKRVDRRFTSKSWTSQMFDRLGGNKKGFVTKDDVRRLNRDEMRAIVLAIEGTDVSNTEEAEYGVIDPGEIRYSVRKHRLAISFLAIEIGVRRLTCPPILVWLTYGLLCETQPTSKLSISCGEWSERHYLLCASRAWLVAISRKWVGTSFFLWLVPVASIFTNRKI